MTKHVGIIGVSAEGAALCYRTVCVEEIPPREDRERISALTFDELVYGQFKASTRAYFNSVIADGQSRGCDAVVLGCTEFPLLIGEADSPIPTLDSTRILARAALRECVR